MAVREIPEVSQRLQMPYEEFLASMGEDVHAEWVDGEVIIHMTAKRMHQELSRFLMELFGLFNQFFSSGYFYAAPYQMKLAPDGPGREPDIFFVARHREVLLKEQGLQGPADLAIEIISDDSVTRDRIEKFEEYEQYGVREYWIIDPRPKRRRAEFYQLDERGQYQPVPMGADGRYHSKVLPGFWLKVDWLWEEPLPKSLFAFAEIANLPQAVVETLRSLQKPQ